MPFLPAGNLTAEDAGNLIHGIAKMLRQECTNWMAACDTGTINAFDFISDFYFDRLKRRAVEWGQLKAVSGVQSVLRSKLPGQFADDAAVTTALNSAQTAMETLATWIENNVQTAFGVAGGHIAILSVVGGLLVKRTHSTGLAALKTQLTTLKNELSA